MSSPIATTTPAARVVDKDTATRCNLRLAKAKTSLVLGHPFVGSIALNLPTVLTYDIPTAATNGKRIAYNPDFMAKLSDEELLFLVAHECMHPMLEHNYRRLGRNARKWNHAADYVINQLLTEEKIGKMPSMGLLNAGLYAAGGGTSDGIYALLPEDDDNGDGGGDGGGDGAPGPLDDCEDAPGDPAEVAQAQAEMKVQVAQAAQAARMMGKLSAGLARLVGEILQPKVDWRDVLAKFLHKAKTDVRSFARFNRRLLPQGLYLPSISGEAMGEVVVAVDCSGSISGRTIAQFAAEIASIRDELCPSRINVFYFDSQVSHTESYGPDDTLDIKPHGGGGTAFSPVFRKIDDLGIEPVACVFLTDLCCDDFGPAPDYPVLWVSTDAGTAPFGEIVLM
jgi:predicted metal-dependent peptidase